MAYTGIWQDNLPWSDSENDRKVVGYIFISLFVCTLLYVIIEYLPVPPVKEQKLEVVAPRLAKLIIEHQKRLQPPPPPQVKKQEKPKALPKQAVKPKPQPQPKREAPHKTPHPQPDHAAVARRQAQQHITEIQDALADLRSMNVASSIEHKKPIRHRAGNRGHPSSRHDNTTAIIAAQASKGSGGINTSRLTRATGSTHLQGRRTTAVTSALASEQARANAGSGGHGGSLRRRPSSELQLVFDRYKSSIMNLYNRALRRDPTLQGSVVVELTITPSGHVSHVRIVSSEIKDRRLLEQLKLRIKLFRFKPMNVDTMIVKYPIDLVPTT